MRLAIGLYCLGRADDYFTMAEMSGVGVSTVAGITEDVCEAIINNLWNDSVVNHFNNDNNNNNNFINNTHEKITRF